MRDDNVSHARHRHHQCRWPPHASHAAHQHGGVTQLSLAGLGQDTRAKLATVPFKLVRGQGLAVDVSLPEFMTGNGFPVTVLNNTEFHGQVDCLC